MSSHEFKAFPKIPRLNREVVVTEKIDGTNALVFVADDGGVLAGSRNRWVEVGKDNFGFASWVKAHEEELRGLGPGYHYGEWWGAGIGRRYDKKEKLFSLFNTHRWATERPACCGVVPVLAQGVGLEAMVKRGLDHLRENGSVAAPGFMQPEGVVVYHTASGELFKVLLEGDEIPKGFSDQS